MSETEGLRKGLTPPLPEPANTTSLAGLCPEGWEEEQGVRAAPDDLRPISAGATTPCSAASGPALALAGQLTDQGRDRTPASPHPGP